MPRPTIVAGNWKMHGTRDTARALARAIVQEAAGADHLTIMLCPPFVHLHDVLEIAAQSPVNVGAQNVCDQPEGAFTGEVSAAMLAELGCSHVLIGHSERRHVYGESDALIQRKFALLHEQTRAQSDNAPIPVLCVGETLAEREAGKTMDVIARQLQPVRQHPEACPRALLAYEPVWAIGTGVAATPEMAQEVHANIREWLRAEVGPAAEETAVLYGGSVKPDNAAELFTMPDIDGGLIGGASLVAEDFMAICECMRK